MKIALAQINTTVGDFAGNEAKILQAYEAAIKTGAELVVYPELATCGYPPRDLLLQDQFIQRNLDLVDRLSAATGPVGMLVGFAGRNPSEVGRGVTNSTALLQHGTILATRSKTLLPTYDVFDEDRYFEPATSNDAVMFNGQSVGLTVCEDIWNDEDYWDMRRYRRNPAADLLQQGVRILFNNSASPWHLGKNEIRRALLRKFAMRAHCPVIYCNLVGGNDELVFDGGSLALDGQGQVLGEAKLFEEDLLLIDTETRQAAPEHAMPDEEKIYRALVLGLRDYLEKCGFKSALLGLSGGIDSALVAAIAADALGKTNVRGVSLPSQYSSSGSLDDARDLAERLGIAYDVIPIKSIFDTAKHELAPVFAGRVEDLAEENIQARIRGVLLMAMSNKFGSLLLTTGNKSELAVGYCTLYGDMCGGLAVINDVPKTMVYRLARWINRHQEIIPHSSITKAPSAELRPDQKDQDTLPPYEVLDAIIEAYVVQSKPPRAIVEMGYDAATVQRVVRLIDFSEYKRRQSAPGLKVTSKAFGVGRRIPIAQRFRAE